MENQCSDTCKAETTSMENKNNDNCRVIDYNLFPTHKKIDEEHLYSVYGPSMAKESRTTKSALIKKLTDMKRELMAQIHIALKNRMVRKARERKISFTTQKGNQKQIYVYYDIKDCFASNLQKQNVANVYYLCYGNFDIEDDWELSMEKDLMSVLNWKYPDDLNTSKISNGYKPGRPTKTCVQKCIAYGKCNLVKAIMKYGELKHGHVIAVQKLDSETTKNWKRIRKSGLYLDDYLIKKKEIYFLERKVCKNEEQSHEENSDDTNELPTSTIIEKKPKYSDSINCKQSVTNQSEYSDSIDWKKKYQLLEQKNKQLLREISAMEKKIEEYQKPTQQISAKDVKDMLFTKSKTKTQTKKLIMSPATSIFSVTSDTTAKREFRFQVMKKRKRAKAMEQRIAKEFNLVIKGKKKINNSPLSITSSDDSSKSISSATISIHTKPIPTEQSQKGINSKQTISSRKNNMEEYSTQTISSKKTNANNAAKNSKKKISSRKNIFQKNINQNISSKQNATQGSTTKINISKHDVDDDKEYVVEKIINHKLKQKQYMFEVKWVGCADTSWEAKKYLDTFVCETVDEYLKSISQKKELSPISSDNESSVSNFSFYNKQPEDCIHEAIYLNQEENTKYCCKGQILYSVPCTNCHSSFEKLNEKNKAYMCRNVGRGCSFVLCQTCYCDVIMKTESEQSRTRKSNRLNS